MDTATLYKFDPVTGSFDVCPLHEVRLQFDVCVFSGNPEVLPERFLLALKKKRASLRLSFSLFLPFSFLRLSLFLPYRRERQKEGGREEREKERFS